MQHRFTSRRAFWEFLLCYVFEGLVLVQLLRPVLLGATILFDSLIKYPDNSFFEILIKICIFEGKCSFMGKVGRYSLLSLEKFSINCSQSGILAEEVLFVRGKSAIIKRAETG